MDDMLEVLQPKLTPRQLTELEPAAFGTTARCIIALESHPHHHPVLKAYISPFDASVRN
jgi:hypothetical protein